MIQMPSFEGWCRKNRYSADMNIFEFFEEILLFPLGFFGYVPSYEGRKKSLYSRYCEDMKIWRESYGR
jgi:hypothetical protein